MPKDKCILCGGLKDIRSKMCRKCMMLYRHPRKDTGRGWVKIKAGYITNCINGKYIYQHRYIMEQHLKRPLTKEEHVHHLDGNRANNELVNLILCKKKEHHKLHMTSDTAKTLSLLGHKARWGK